MTIKSRRMAAPDYRAVAVVVAAVRTGCDLFQSGLY